MRNFEQQSTSIGAISSQAHQKTKNTQRDLRYILTQKCNYNCTFCHKESMDGQEKELLNIEDYLYLYGLSHLYAGINGVTFTGGEPLISKKFPVLAEKLKNYGAFLTVVTNGSLLEKKLENIRYLDRINISLHNLDQELYKKLTGQHLTSPYDVLKYSILIKETYPHIDVRLNSTLLKSYFEHPEALDILLDIVKQYGFTIKFIELFPNTDPLFISHNSIIHILKQHGFVFSPDVHLKDNHRYVWGKAQVILRKCSCDFVKTNGLSQEFCKKNNDLFLSPDGKISSCLAESKKFDLYTAIKNRANDEIISIFSTIESPDFSYACTCSSQK